MAKTRTRTKARVRCRLRVTAIPDMSSVSRTEDDENDH